MRNNTPRDNFSKFLPPKLAKIISDFLFFNHDLNTDKELVSIVSLCRNTKHIRYTLSVDNSNYLTNSTTHHQKLFRLKVKKKIQL